MNIREQRQQEASDSFLNVKDNRAILLMAPRTGKCRTAFKIIKELNPKSILLCYPRNDIQRGWIEEGKLLNFDLSCFDYTTFASIKKIDKKYDLIIVDEIHELSSQQKNNLKEVCDRTPTLGLTGTLTRKTAESLNTHLNLPVCYNYSINKAVSEGVLSPYTIQVHKVDLDDTVKYIKAYKSYDTLYTEKAHFEKLNYRNQYIKEVLKVSSMGESIKLNKELFYLNLKQINIIQNSIAKLNKTISLIEEFNDKRILVFCGTTQTTDSIGIPVYHSKAKEKKVFEDFADGKGQFLATIKMLQAGKRYARYKPL